MKRLQFILMVLIFSVGTSSAQTEISGHVYAFKDLTLNNITVHAKKSKQSVQTDQHGFFKIQCGKNDRLSFEGQGFHKVTQKISDSDALRVKLILITNEKNINLAVENKHVDKAKLETALNTQHEYNFVYYNYSNIFELLKKMYLRDISIRSDVSGTHVYAKRQGSTEFHNLRALYLVNGKREEDISYIDTRQIKYIKMYRDGESKYNTAGFFGAVEIETFVN